MAAPTTSSELDSTDQKPPTSLFLRTRRKVPLWAWYTLAAFGFALLIVIVQLAFYLQRTEPRDARTIVERELRLNTLRPDERVVRTVSVFRRTGVDYFRATRGLLVLTDKRLVYLGVPPRDISGASGAAPTFDQREFAIDTLVRVTPSFSVLGFSRALKIDAPEGKVIIGISSGEWQKAKLLHTAWETRHQRLRAIGVWSGKVRTARAELQTMLVEYRKQPVYHVVRPGDAVSSIASWYEIPEAKLREQNRVIGNKIKVGQRLLIRSGG